MWPSATVANAHRKVACQLLRWWTQLKKKEVAVWQSGKGTGFVTGRPGLRFWLSCSLTSLFTSLVSVFPSVKGLNDIMYKCFVSYTKRIKVEWLLLLFLLLLLLLFYYNVPQRHQAILWMPSKQPGIIRRGNQARNSAPAPPWNKGMAFCSFHDRVHL